MLQKSWAFHLPRPHFTNFTRSFQNSSIVELGLSDFYIMIITVLKQHFTIVTTKYYRDYSTSENRTLRECLSMIYQKKMIRKSIMKIIVKHL